MKRILIISSLILNSFTFLGQGACGKLDKMISQLKQAEFGKVYSTRDCIVNLQDTAIPKLIQMLKDTSYVKLKNTFDLIYPGAENHYMHGGVVNYAIDWLCARSAWILEEITFQNFGYYDDYYKINKTALKSYRKSLADSVAKWWLNNSKTWNRFDALKEALSSTDVLRQIFAIQYLRNDHTSCNNLTIANYETYLKPLVKKISESKNDASDIALLLLNDTEGYWYRNKTRKNVR